MPRQITNSRSNTQNTDMEWKKEKNQLILKLRGRPIVTYAPDNIDKNEISKFYKKSNNNNRGPTRNNKNPPKGNPKPENVDISIRSAFNYRGQDARRNLYILKSREIIYFTAGLVIIQDPYNPGKQRIFNQHTDDIKALAVHSNGYTIASGQICGLKADDSKRPAHILIWDSNSFEIYRKLGVNQIFKGPISLFFSYPDVASDKFNVDYLACVDEHNDHCLRIWNWTDKSTEEPRIEKNTTKDTVVGLEFYPNTESKRYLVVFGKQLTFYCIEVHGGKDANKKAIDVVSKKRNAVFEKTQKPKIIVSACISPSGQLMTGGSDGLIISWGDKAHLLAESGKSPTPVFMYSAHKGAVFTLSMVSGEYAGFEECFFSGGKDGFISVWNLEDVKTNQAPIASVGIPGSARCVAATNQSEGIIVGSTSNEIYLHQNGVKKELTFGHTGEVWALALSNDSVFSGCDDGRLVVHDTLTGLHKWNVKLAEGIRSVTIQPLTNNIFVGTTNGKIVAFSYESEELLTNEVIFRESSSSSNSRGGGGGKSKHAPDISITCMEFNHDGTLLAAGCRDQNVYIFDATEAGELSPDGKLTKKHVLKGHSSTILHIDWPKNHSKFLRSQSAAHELQFWSLEKDKIGVPCPQSNKNNTIWKTNTCTFDFSVLGIWEAGLDGTDINQACKYGNLLFLGDDFGRVRVYEYPCWKLNSEHEKLFGHSSHVTRVKMSPDGRVLASAGGMDNTVVLWDVEGAVINEDEDQVVKNVDDETQNTVDLAAVNTEENDALIDLSASNDKKPDLSRKSLTAFEASLPVSHTELANQNLQNQESNPAQYIDQSIQLLNNMVENAGR